MTYIIDWGIGMTVVGSHIMDCLCSDIHWSARRNEEFVNMFVLIRTIKLFMVIVPA